MVVRRPVRRERRGRPESRRTLWMALIAALGGAVLAVVVAIVLAHVLQVAVR
jgi:hypothetical protein